MRPSISSRTALRPACAARSLKSLAPSGKASGQTATPRTARAASCALSRPGLRPVLASVSRSLSAHITINAAGYALRIAFATCGTLPASKATATGRPVASCTLAPVA